MQEYLQILKCPEVVSHVNAWSLSQLAVVFCRN